MASRSRLESVSTKLRRIAAVSRQSPKMRWTTLAHNIDEDFLREAHRLVRKDAAVGVDGVTASEYGKDLDANLESLLNRFKSGHYRAPAVRRAWISKADGKRRPLGIPTFEDKILQKAIQMVLEAVYEQDFLDCSYGFRRGRSALQASDAVREQVMKLRGAQIVEVDIQSYFDCIDHRHLREILDQRVGDGVIRRMIDKWLKAGVLEGGVVRHPNSGTPQGGVISPLLANVYLHEVLDTWFETVVKPRMNGEAHLVRYCDDFVAIFELPKDAQRFENVLPKRFGKYGLTLHPEKTGRLDFHRPPLKASRKKSRHWPDSFQFLGFTYYWGKSRKGYWVVCRKTDSRRLTAALGRARAWCCAHRHLSVSVQHQHLCKGLRGHYAYYGVTGNFRSLTAFYQVVRKTWWKWLRRRSQRAGINTEQWIRLLQRYPLPKPRIVHSVYHQTAKLPL